MDCQAGSGSREAVAVPNRSRKAASRFADPSSVRVNRGSLRPRAAAWTFMLSPVPFRVRRSSWTRPSGKEEAMKYMLLIHQGNTPVPGTPAWEALSEDERKAIADDYQAINQTEGVTPGEWMESPETATTVRVENGEALTTDGPFVAVKEALGGYLFFEAENLDAAIELASRIPAARLGGAIEIRPLKEA